MIKYFLYFTDNFLCDNLKKIIEKAELDYEQKGISIELSNELDALDEDPLVCYDFSCSEFTKRIKRNIKVLLGIFFVAIPMISLSAAAYLLGIDFAYVLAITIGIAVFSTIRMENIVHRYTQLRYATLAS